MRGAPYAALQIKERQLSVYQQVKCGSAPLDVRSAPLRLMSVNYVNEDDATGRGALT